MNPRTTYRGLERSAWIDALVERRSEKLKNKFGAVQSVHVVLSLLDHRHRKGHYLHVRVEMKMNSGFLFVDRETEKQPEHQNSLVAVQDAFDAAERKVAKALCKHQFKRASVRRGGPPMVEADATDNWWTGSLYVPESAYLSH